VCECVCVSVFVCLWVCVCVRMYGYAMYVCKVMTDQRRTQTDIYD